MTSRAISRRYVSVAATAVLAAVCALLVVFAALSPGYPVRHVQLHDGGIWVTNNSAGLFGRLNKPIGQLDGGFAPSGGAQANYHVDILQNDQTVVAVDSGQGRLSAVDTARDALVPSGAVNLPAGYAVALGATTLAVLDPATGKLWTSRVDGTVAQLGGVDTGSAPTLNLKGADSDVTVGVDGTVYAASASTGQLATLAPAGKPVTAPLGQHFSQVQLAAVGSKIVALDPTDGHLNLPGGKTASLPGVSASRPAVLQQSGPDADEVLAATTAGFYGVGWDGSVRVIYGAPVTAGVTATRIGTPARPARLGLCMHAAWTGIPGTYVQACNSAAGTKRDLPAGGPPLTDPIFRINHEQIVLNDRDNGGVWDIDQKPILVADWSSIRPKTNPNNDNSKTNHQVKQDSTSDRPPEPKPDSLGARPDRTSVLHVLDNDADPDGDVLVISAVTPAVLTGATATIAPDGQTVQLAVAAGTTGSLHFRYTVDDGHGKSGSAEVSVAIRTPSENSPPVLRPGYLAPSLTVAATGTVSYPVLSDWRDPDSDPLVLTGATAASGVPVTTEDGQISYTAGAAAGRVAVHYHVTDNLAAPVAGTLGVNVLGRSDTTAVSAKAEPDVVEAILGEPVTVHPLANDIPGSDPTDLQARLTLAAPVAASGGASVTTDRTAGTVTFTSTRTGTVLLSYGAAFGSAKVAAGVIRVDVAAPPKQPLPPVAMPDTAVLHGEQSITMDPLANDYAPSGGLLVVIAAKTTAAVKVGIIRGHWLRIESTSAGAQGSEVIRYTITDGNTAPVTGEVAVTQLPAPAVDSPPVAQNDLASVRAGDAVSVPVLDNDSDPDGDPLTLVPGALTVTGPAVPANLGTAYLAGNTVRFAAPDPSTVTAAYQASVGYLVADPSGATARGTLTVTVNPPATDLAHDQPPAPQSVDVNGVAGDTMVISVPVTGVDPDGDSVAVTGVASAPQLGRISAITATSLSYQAYPLSHGTDTFRYQVTDPSGLTGTATIRVGLTPPSQLQPPLAVADTLTAAPGSTVRVNVLSNDFYDVRSTAILPLAQTNGDLPAGVKLDGTRIVIPVPVSGTRPIVVSYGLTEGFGDPSTALVTIQPRAGFDNPPVARDDYPVAALNHSTVAVDVLANDDDPDGPTSALHALPVGDPAVTVAADKLVIPLKNVPYTVGYRVTDAHGGSALGLVHVPAKLTGTGPPRLKPGVSPIVLARNATRTVNLSAYVYDPAGKPLRLTTSDQISASPQSGLAATATGAFALKLKAGNDYIGPGAVTVEVTDGTSLSDPAGQRAVVSIPVQIGPVTPVFRCPTDPVTVVQGGRVQSVDLFQLCHVWTDDSATANALNFAAHWMKQATGVTLGASGHGGSTLVLTPTNAARPGGSGTITVSAGGAKGIVHVSVLAATPPTVSAIAITGIRAGQSATVDVADHLSSPLAHPQPAITGVSQESGLPGTAKIAGTRITLIPAAKSHGQLVFGYRVTDIAGNTSRVVAGSITLNVLGLPATPSAPQLVSLGDSSVVISFGTPNGNGAPIDGYRVTDQAGHQHSCAASPCTLTGLHNGTDYTWRIRAHNIVGYSDPSAASAPMRPDKLPEPVASVTAVPGDRSAAVSWKPPVNKGTSIRRYDLQISPDPGSGAIHSTAGTTMTLRGLTNGVSYSLRVRAVNGKGPGDFGARTPVIPFGTPAQPAPPTATGVQDVTAQQAISVSWPGADGNGRPVSGYTVTGRGSKGQRLGPVKVTGLNTSFTVPNDSSSYSFTYTATNAGLKTSPPSRASNAVVAAGIPGKVTDVTVSDHASGATAGYDSAMHIMFTVPAANAAANTRVDYTVNGGNSQSETGNYAPGSSQTIVVGGLSNGSSYHAQVRVCNDQGQCGAWSDNSAPPDAVPYGAPPKPTFTVSRDGDRQLKYSWTSGPSNGRAITFHVLIDGNPAYTGPNANTIDRNGYAYTSTHTISGYITDEPGNRVDGASASATTNDAPPPPDPTVTVFWGPSCAGECTTNKGLNCSSSCHWFALKFTNAPTGSYRIQCHTTYPSPVTFHDGHTTITSDTYSGRGDCFENVNDPGAQVYVIVTAPNGKTFQSPTRAWASAQNP